MSNDLNKIILIGRLTKDPELKYTQSGTAVANFSVACNKSYTKNGEKKETVSFFNCIAWAKLGEVVTQYCKKGERICIEGRLQQKIWEDNAGVKRYNVEIVVESVQFLSTKKDSTTETGTTGSQSEIPAAENPFSEDDIPF